jgi:hypothetical protein
LSNLTLQFAKLIAYSANHFRLFDTRLESTVSGREETRVARLTGEEELGLAVVVVDRVG